MSELSDYKRLVEAPAIRSYEATITSLRAEVEKLKAERDEWKGNYERVASDGDAARSEITRLTSQLEQAERVRERAMYLCQSAGRMLRDCPEDVRLSGYGLDLNAERARFEQVASQWIKDRQAKGDGEAS